MSGQIRTLIRALNGVVSFLSVSVAHELNQNLMTWRTTVAVKMLQCALFIFLYNKSCTKNPRIFQKVDSEKINEV